jgi:hypothetical protein
VARSETAYQCGSRECTLRAVTHRYAARCDHSRELPSRSSGVRSVNGGSGLATARKTPRAGTWRRTGTRSKQSWPRALPCSPWASGSSRIAAVGQAPSLCRRPRPPRPLPCPHRQLPCPPLRRYRRPCAHGHQTACSACTRPGLDVSERSPQVSLSAAAGRRGNVPHPAGLV